MKYLLSKRLWIYSTLLFIFASLFYQHYQARWGEGLHRAAHDGSVFRTKLMLALGADIDKKSIAPDRDLNVKLKDPLKAHWVYEWWKDTTPLQTAALSGNADVVKTLIDAGADLDGTIPTYGCVVKDLLLYVINEAERKEVTAEQVREKCKIITYLIKAGYDSGRSDPVYFQGMINSYAYGCRASREIFGAMLDGGLINNLKEYSFHRFYDLEDLSKFRKLVQALREHGVNPNTEVKFVFYRDSLLNRATLFELEDIVEELLKDGADPNRRGVGDLLPLHAAAERRNDKLIKLLLKYGADVNGVDYRDRTALFFIGRWGDREEADIARLLQVHGAKINHRDRSGNTPLHTVVQASLQNGNAYSVREMLRYRSTPNSRNRYGNTSIHALLDMPNLSGIDDEKFECLKEILDLLLSSGGNINALTNRGYTPYDIARRAGENRSSDHIKKLGGKSRFELMKNTKDLTVK